MDKVYRDGLPPLPDRMKQLAVHRGYPVPWFVLQPPYGDTDFRVIGPGKFEQAVTADACWICGERLGKFKTFILGPMCAITKTTSEPPSHRDCALFAVVACPFLTQAESGYRENNLPAGVIDPAGHAIKRQPGVALAWTCVSYNTFPDDVGRSLIKVGEPTEVGWWSHGRKAMRNEIYESIGSGFPILFEMAKVGGLRDILELNRQLETAMKLVP